ncbi:centrosomal protein of 152 kDa [Trichomycterus rosablanca]|uniref:centrosomal protein of 152 kDa n=1 Tax=Trichomycterus rosablanca TaxID=2290929 RepID=UPI002F353A10
MSIDFDSAALQTQHEEEEYDQEDFAREQELHKLLTDLPDDMLEDSHDSSPELDHSTCSPRRDNGAQHSWNGQSEWSNQPHPHSAEENRTEHLALDWNTHHGQNYQYEPADCVYSSAGTADSDFSTEEGYEQAAYPHMGLYHRTGNHEDEQGHEIHTNGRNRFQNFDNGVAKNEDVDCYEASYQPQNPAHQANMFNVQPAHQNGHFDQLQRDFLDASPTDVNAQECAQLKILNKAQSRQIEHLEQKLEDNRRKVRYLEHQFAIVKDEKEGLALSLKESGCLIDEAKDRESQLQKEVNSMERQIQMLTEREQENIKKQHAAEAAVDSLQKQMTELCRSETLTRAREQHDRDVAAMREQHEARVLALQQKLDSVTQSLNEQVQAGQRLREQVKQLERQREEEQVDRAAVINALTQRLEESQQQCAKLLQTGSVQEMSQMQIKLQQAQSSRNISENMNKALQEELNELKEQVTLYESAVKLGTLSFDSNPDWENQLSESYIDLGIKKVNWKKDKNNSTPALSDSSQSKTDLTKDLKTELQRCLAQLKSKREKISQLQEDLRTSHSRLEQLQTQLQGAEKMAKDSVVRENSLEKLLEQSSAPHKELVRLETERQQLQKRVEALEMRNKELKQSEEKVKAANSELCIKMREMIQELDQEKQEAAERYERTQQQYRDDVVQHVRAELVQEHSAHVEQLTARHQHQIQQLESKLADLNQEVLAVQECYLSVCKEKDKLEEALQSRIKEEKLREAKFEKNSAQRLEEALREKQKAKAAETQEGSSQTNSSESETQLISLEQLETRLGEQRVALQQEADNKLAKAVEEAGRRRERELQQKHVQDMSLQVEGAVSTAQDSWLRDLTSLPEYKTNLQTEREQWEKLQEQYTQEQVSSAIKASEDKWQEIITEKLKELDSSLSRNQELQDKVHNLTTQLKHHSEEQTSLLKSELSAARDLWNTEKQEEISCLRSQFQREQNSQLQKHQAQLERITEETREEAIRQGQAQLQEALHRKEQEWRSQQERILLKERQRAKEEVLRELQEVLKELHERRVVSEEQESMDGSLRSKLRDLCRKALVRSVASAKHEWMKSSEEKLKLVLKETQEQHEKELNHIRSSSAQRSESVCDNKSCTETSGKLQKKCQELQRHLEKACRQLQHTVREHKNTLHKLKEEHEDALCTEREAHAKALEAKLSESKELSDGDGRQNLNAGLDEMKEQYLKAVQKIRGDMLRYLQESKERAAELIRAEVLRERQDTARRMRKYYLTCLQELLEEGGQTTGAEKKIINAASKLAAMAKVLETPVAKKKLQRNQNIQDASPNLEASKIELGLKGVVSSQSLSAESNEHHKTHQVNYHPETSYATQTVKIKEVKPVGKSSYSDFKSVKAHSAKGPERPEQLTPGSLHSVNLASGNEFASSSVHNSTVNSANVTLRKQSREMFLMGTEAGKASERLTPQVTVQPFLIEEAPVRDDGQSDWSLSSNGSAVIHDFHFSSSYRSKLPNLLNIHSLTGHSVEHLDFGSHLGDDSDVTVYKEIAKKPSDMKPKLNTHSKASKSREPIPGSEEENYRLCPKSLFSEFKMCLKDSGIDSPLPLLQK